MIVTAMLMSLLATLVKWDTTATLAINGFHCDYLDNFMMMYSGRFIWIPLYLSLFVVMVRKFPLKPVICNLLLMVILITLCDQIVSSGIRPFAYRLRPANLDNPISPLVHVVDGYRGGRYGFPSAHAANCWGAFFFVSYVFRRSVMSYVLAAWALVMCWSRVYLGVHYVGDVTCGMLVGLANASVVYYLFQHYLRKYAQPFRPKENTCKLYTPAVVCGVETLCMLIMAFFTRFSF